MTLSFWRYSHFLLASISSLFLVLASVTGAILAFEPITAAAQPYVVDTVDEIVVSDVIAVLQEEYAEVLELKRTPANAVIAAVLTEEGNSKTIYIDPVTGKEKGVVEGKSPFFSFVTNLHRSLFFKSIGRFFVGFISLLLSFIAVTGILLLVQRQGGIRKFFSRVKETNVAQRYHVILGKWFFIPVLIIALTGVYLSLEKFSLLPATDIEHHWNIPSSVQKEKVSVFDFKIFEDISLKELRELSFPFSEDPQDFYQMALENKELLIHQYTGEVISEIEYPFTQLFSSVSLLLHTGQGSVLWSFVLLIASISILFFIYSGFVMFLKRRKKTKKNTSEFSKEHSEFIILVGSETGNTFEAAKAFYKSLVHAGKTVFLSTLNEYTRYKNAKHLIVFTATYGDGDAPNNARKFEKLLHTVTPPHPIQFTVLGFGSKEYPKYCRFAIKVDGLLHGHPAYKPFLPLTKINEQSIVALNKWQHQWSNRSRAPLVLESLVIEKKGIAEQNLTVVRRTSLNVDDTFLLELKPSKKLKFKSGDLLGVLVEGEDRKRQYSIARNRNNILLSVKKHAKGICSSHLYTIPLGTKIVASIDSNVKFHLPREAPSIVLIANGTGMGPFLGFISENKKQLPIHLFWGGRTRASFQLYQEQLNDAISQKRLMQYKVAYSREAPKQYVQDLLAAEEVFIAKIFSEGGTFMICGSLKMQAEVLSILEEVCKRYLSKDLHQFEHNGQLLMDCY